MTKKGPLLLWMAICMVLLAACAGAAKSTPEPIASIPSATVSPTAVLTVLPLISPQPPRRDKPTIVPTPALAQTHYQLKNWSEENALSLIRSAELYANSRHGETHMNETNYELVKLAIREMQFRFPSSPYQNLLNWRLAMADAMVQSGSDDPEFNDWMLNEIELGLNQQRFTLNTLDAALIPQGFRVREQFAAKNLFRHGDDGMIYHISLNKMYYDEYGLVFAVRGNAPGHYKVIKVISSDWMQLVVGETDSGTAIPELEGQDRNGNGLSEIVVELYYNARHGCMYTNIPIFEWDGNRFVDLTRKTRFEACTQWRFGEPGTADAGKLIVSSPYPKLTTKKYKWDGAYYELDTSRMELDHVDCETVISDYSVYPHDARNLESLLKNWEEENTLSLGASCYDYIHLKISIFYAADSEPATARKMLQSVSPSSKLWPVVNVFLQQYITENQLYQACQAAQKVLDKVYQDDKDKLPAAQFHAAWLGDLLSEKPSSLCDLSETFPFLVRSLQGVDVVNPLAAFKNNGAVILDSRKMDIDGDGALDWLVNIHRKSDLIEMWGVLTTPNGLLPVRIGRDTVEKSLPKTELFQMPGTDKFFLISFGGGELMIHHVNRRSMFGPSAEYEFSRLHVQSYVFRQTSTGVELEVSLGSKLPFSFIEFYRWNVKQSSFELLPLYNNNIFAEGGPAEYLPYLQRIVATVDEKSPNAARFLYLLGLAYELTGDKAQAAQTYWMVWHDFSGTGYAVMAQGKIEPIAP